MPVYALIDPRTKATRYVGMSKRPTDRFRQHIAKAHSACLRDWITDLRSAGLVPELRMLDGATEREWIVRLAPDLNSNLGHDDLDPGSVPFTFRLPGPLLVAYRAQAGQMKVGLSAWLRMAADEKLENDRKKNEGRK